MASIRCSKNVFYQWSAGCCSGEQEGLHVRAQAAGTLSSVTSKDTDQPWDL